MTGPLVPKAQQHACMLLGKAGKQVETAGYCCYVLRSDTSVRARTRLSRLQFRGRATKTLGL